MNQLQNLEIVQENRAAFRETMHEFGITEEYISLLVETFYSRIREHQELGPIFNHTIDGNWEIHLAKMKTFWSSIALKTNTYKGKPMPAHQKLSGVSHKNFEDWLSLFRQTLEDTAPNEKVVEVFMCHAHTIAPRLESMMKIVD